MSDEWLTVGYVAGVHGVRGALKVRLHDPASQAVRIGATLQLWRDDAHVGDFEVAPGTSATERDGEFRVVLAGVGDREAADALRGCELRVERAALPPLAPDEYYLADLVGSVVVRARDGGTSGGVGGEVGEELGEVVGVSSNGPQDLLEIEWTSPAGKRHGWLLPALPGFVLDVLPGRVLADVPPGFLPDELEGEPEKQ